MIVLFTVIAIFFIMLFFVISAHVQLKTYIKTADLTLEFTKNILNSIATENKLTREALENSNLAYKELIDNINRLDLSNYDDLKLDEKILDTELLTLNHNNFEKINKSLTSIHQALNENNNKFGSTINYIINDDYKYKRLLSQKSNIHRKRINYK